MFLGLIASTWKMLQCPFYATFESSETLHCWVVTNTKRILKQNNSWDRILATLSAIQQLLSHFCVFPLFVDYLHVFGYKTDEEFSGYFRSRKHDAFVDLETENVHALHDLNPTSLCWLLFRWPDLLLCWLIEICCIWYPESSGRSEGNPWPVRQIAVYQQYDAVDDCHLWIIIQPSEGFQLQLSKILSPSKTRMLKIWWYTLLSSCP